MTGTCNSTPASTVARLPRVRVGLDLIQISRIADSTRCFGDRFKNRLFTPDELDYAQSGGDQTRHTGLCAERLAARFAAKEATIKALNLSHDGVNWKHIEVLKLHGGGCMLMLHGPVAEIARELGLAATSLSLSHDGDYAAAVVAMTFEPPDTSLFDQRFTHVQ